jgi:hypothetical protein
MKLSFKLNKKHFRITLKNIPYIVTLSLKLYLKQALGMVMTSFCFWAKDIMDSPTAPKVL